MKKDIHPIYYPTAKVKCSCGNEFQIGATKENIDVEVCSACHPFYTGDDRGRARGSQVEKFRERLAKKDSAKSGSLPTGRQALPTGRQALPTGQAGASRAKSHAK